ncbi:UDP-glucoronosyl and UDP-glucosyl transferase domain-containing protein [Trichoderma breve]|uniref:UDP-glucoronosyl and UDP-glucosyl transferase domain-containing protein n=1 Tax=Trichoderma breve TaxID=2034170 RepID=A0A9W9EEU7_9HYPO|nr:UDP-glucoronosyl and UDP-glucosyl transferase domain-containing protein [Trichoderma breve]KAJ4865374.1 UDP-glucoronosyl and UDP-glucosyl transferase domain-containing protein [Trichoderma breve]
MAPFIRRRILLITNVECGELDLFLATAQSLLETDPGLDLHLATFSGLDDDALPVGVIYHQINGISMYQAIEELLNRTQDEGSISEPFAGPPGFRKTRRAIRAYASQIMPYTGRQMVDVFTSIVDIIRNLNPDLVVVDSLMSAGLTACYHLEVKFVCLGPNSIKDFAASEQPRKAGLWKFPALFSQFEYPVPWSKVPLNFHFSLYTAKAIKNDPQRKEVQSYLTAHTILRGPLDLLKNRPEGLKILVGSLPELDFPLVVPSHVIPCGPIIRRCQPLEETDAKLAEWLAHGRTIYVNMGAVVKVPVDQAIEIAKALKMVIDTFNRQAEKGRLQVLWKLKKKGRYSVYEPTCSIAKILRQEFAHDRVRIVDWVQPEPVSILRTGNVVCSVHHGGANSFNEAIVSGVPQLVLPVWGLCYDYAQRVERLGVGRCGNPTSKPRWTAEELSRELLNVLVGDEAKAIKANALAVKKICKQNGSGADCAAMAILNECEM